MPGIPWSMREILSLAGETLGDWQTAAMAAGVRVDQINLTLLGPVERMVIFEWDTEAGEYSFRTVDS